MKHLTILRAFLTATLLASCRAADVAISALPAISSVQSGTLVPVVDVSGTPTTKKATVSQFLNGLSDANAGARGIMTASQATQLGNATDANTASTIVARDTSGNFSANVITATAISGLASPVAATDAANKGYVDAAAAGLIIKTPGVAGTIGSNITLTSGAPNTLDGVTLHANDRILVKDQTDNKENGIYYVATLGSGSNGTWTRSTDADTGAELVTGSYIFLSGGTINVNAAYTMVTPGAIVIGTSPIVWNLFSQVTQIQAANIIGQIVASQVQDGAINTAKFAASITPVEIASSLPGSGNFAGRTVFLTTDSKLYRYNGSSFIATYATTDLTGTITNTQIADNSISTPKLQANSVTASILAANSVVAGDITANAVTAGTIAAAAVSTTELAANAVTTAKLAAGAVTASQIAANTITAGQIATGTITADRMNVSSLSAISANLGTITAGTITAVSISSGVISGGSIGSSYVKLQASSGFYGVLAGSLFNNQASLQGDMFYMTNAGASVNNVQITGGGTGGGEVRVYDNSGNNNATLVGGTSSGSGRGAVKFRTATIYETGSNAIRTNSAWAFDGSVVLSASSTLAGLSGAGINLFGGDSASIKIICGEDGAAGSLLGYIVLNINGNSRKVPFYSL